MSSRNRAAPTAAAMSIECTTSANKTVTCLYSAGFVPVETAAPHWLQNLAFSFSSVPQDPHESPVAVISRGQPTVVHVIIVSPLVRQRRSYRVGTGTYSSSRRRYLLASACARLPPVGCCHSEHD